MSSSSSSSITSNIQINWVVLNNFGITLVKLNKLFLILTVTILFCSVPLYILKGLNDDGKFEIHGRRDFGGNHKKEDTHTYATHTHQYQWFLTAAYFSGSLPGLLFMVLCFILLTIFIIFLSTLDEITLENQNSLNNNNNNNNNTDNNINNNDNEELVTYSQFLTMDNITSKSNSPTTTTTSTTNPSQLQTNQNNNLQIKRRSRSQSQSEVKTRS